MSGGHNGRSAADCAECWEIAYEPGWYAVLSASESVQPPGFDGVEVLVRLPENDAVGVAYRRATHASVAAWRGRRPGQGSPADEVSRAAGGAASITS